MLLRMPEQILTPFPGLPRQIHLHPTGPLAERVLLPGDPGRALRLAQALTDGPLMFNHNRGLWGYTGAAKHDGEPLTIQATGMGGPSAAIVVSELITLGARRIVRVGSCGALDAALAIGDLLVVTEAIVDDGTSRALGAAPRVAASHRPTADLLAASDGRPASGPAVSTDLFYGAEGRWDGWRAAGARVVEMECATVFALARASNTEASAVVFVSDRLEAVPVRINDEALREAELAMGALALAAVPA